MHRESNPHASRKNAKSLQGNKDVVFAAFQAKRKIHPNKDLWNSVIITQLRRRSPVSGWLFRE